MKLSKDKFSKILDEYPSIQKSFLVLLANKIHSKSKNSKEIINQKPKFKILAFLNILKKITMLLPKNIDSLHTSGNCE